MIKKFVIFWFLLSSICYSQNFTASDQYKVIGLDYEERQALFESGEWEGPVVAHLTNSRKSAVHLKQFEIINLETFDSVYVMEWVNPGFKNVDRILWVRFDYAACCIDYEIYYFLVTKKGQLIELPEINFSFCDYPGDIEEYTFVPEQMMIQRVINSYRDIETIDSTHVVQTIHWDGAVLSDPDR